ncbi:MAG TPA: SpoIID/LytB domain-containing protein [Acidimicrobiales bacterium]|nr:SpoIID/LytB domain-containing protein [Acidimicrobiales bacterium]
MIAAFLAAVSLPGRPRDAVFVVNQDFPSGTVQISGYGYGHGRGLGQWGAYGYSTIYGWSYQQILAHYYGGTTLGSLPSSEPDISVHLVELDGHNAISAALVGQSLVASWAGGSAISAPAFEVTRSGGLEAVFSGPSCSGPWSQLATTSAPVVISSSEPGTSPPSPSSVDGSMLQACIPGIGSRTYQGQLTVQADGQTLNVVPLEDYVDGVVPAESPVSWAASGGEAALEAQAVAARSYALATVGAPGSSGEVCDTTACQMYTGWPNQYGVTADPAVTATDGQVLYCEAGSTCGPGGSVALAEYSSSTGGYTAGGAFPAVPDLGDSVAANPVHSWSVQVPVSKVESAFPAVGDLQQIEVTERNGLGQLGGRVEELDILGSLGSLQLTGSQFRAALALPSNWFEIGGAPLTSPTTTTATVTTTTARGAGTTSTTGMNSPTSTTGAASTTATTSPGSATPITQGTCSPCGVPGGTQAACPPCGAVPDNGYWVADAAGNVQSFGAASSFGTAAGTALGGVVRAMAATPDDRGYWLAGSNGGVLAFGDAHFYGSASKLHLAKPVVAIAATADGRGYWLVSSDGGIFAFGDAHFYGSTGAFHLNKMIAGIAATPDGRGYWLVSSDGGIFVFGDAGFWGSVGNLHLNEPVSGIVPSADGRGYFLVARDGGVFAFGDARFEGSLPGEHIVATVVAVAPTADGGGYYVLTANGAVYGLGDARTFGDPHPSGWSGAVAIVGYRSPNRGNGAA